MEEEKIENIEEKTENIEETVTVEKNDKLSNKEVNQITTNSFLATSVVLLVVALTRVFASVFTLGDLPFYLNNTEVNIRKIGIILLAEMIFMVVNFVLALINFILCNSLKKSVSKNEQTEKQFKIAKVFSTIMSVVFVAFIVFEIASVIMVKNIFESYELEYGILASLRSLVITGAYTVCAFINTNYISKTENNINKNSL